MMLVSDIRIATRSPARTCFAENCASLKSSRKHPLTAIIAAARVCHPMPSREGDPNSELKAALLARANKETLETQRSQVLSATQRTEEAALELSLAGKTTDEQERARAALQVRQQLQRIEPPHRISQSGRCRSRS